MVFWYCRRPLAASVGLPLAYAALLSVAHFGAVIYLLPWYDPLGNVYLVSAGVSRPNTIRGFAATTLGLAAFCLGALVRDKLFGANGIARRTAATPAVRQGRNLLLVGAASYFIVSRLSWVPGAGSITSAGANLAVVGFCLLMHSRGTDQLARLRLMMGTLAFPLITTVSAGFLGFGVTAILQTGSFFVRSLRLRSWFIVVLPFVLWLGLSAYVTYMAARNDIRRQVWGGGGLVGRFGSITQAFTNAQFFDPWNNDHLYGVDGRLNQNSLVGSAIEYMELTHKEPAYGRSLAVAAIAWVPRILWPGKPQFGGSGNLVSQYTGIQFAEGTSVGVGNVMELYINFGTAGIVVGFMVFGAVLRHLDFRAASALQRGQTWDYVFYHLLGLSAVQPGGMWAEVVGACAAAGLLVTLLRRTGMRA